MVIATMNTLACRCIDNVVSSPTQLPQHRSTALQRAPYQALPGHRVASANRSPAAAWSHTAPITSTARCQALPGPSEIASLADAGVAGLGNAIDDLVSSGGSTLGAEIAQVGTTPSASSKYRPVPSDPIPAAAGAEGARAVLCEVPVYLSI